MTFSLAGYCPRTGMLGAVITTSSPAVGARCVFGRAGIGIVLTQNRTDPRLGPRGLALLAEGCSPNATIAALAASTPDAGWRQLAVLDAQGGSAHYSGTNIRSQHAGVSGVHCVAAGNILRHGGVPASMVEAFAAASDQKLPERLLIALEAGEASGGELLPLRSAALLIVRAESFPYADLRVDAAANPIGALRMLWNEYAPQADEYVTRAIAPDAIAPLTP